MFSVVTGTAGDIMVLNFSISFRFIVYNRSAGFAIFPAMAVAAAVAGDASIVRAPGPWRPSKFLFDVLTQ